MTNRKTWKEKHEAEEIYPIIQEGERRWIGKKFPLQLYGKGKGRWKPKSTALKVQERWILGGDELKKTFFYQAIGFGRSVKEAFEQGKLAIIFEGIPNVFKIVYPVLP